MDGKQTRGNASLRTREEGQVVKRFVALLPARHVLRVFGGIGVHEVPVLGVGDEDVHGGLEEGWIVEAGGGDADEIVFRILRPGEARTAVGTEAADVVAAQDASGAVMFQLAFRDAERAERDDDDGQVRSPAELLAVAAVAF
jgi:hypothetical protein